MEISKYWTSTSRTRIAFWSFLGISLAHLFALAAGISWTATWTKPLLLPVLAAGFYAFTRGRTRFSRYIFGGLLLSWLGDVLLMLVPVYGELFFILGLTAFLLAHVFYTSAFIMEARGNGWIRRSPWAVLPFLIYLIIINAWWWPDLGDMRIPVVLYSVVITVMGLSALNLRLRMQAGSYGMLMAGVILFLLSDSLIAVNKFKEAFSGASFLIMLTYILAQAFICTAAMGLFRDGKTGS